MTKNQTMFSPRETENPIRSDAILKNVAGDELFDVHRFCVGNTRSGLLHSCCHACREKLNQSYELALNEMLFHMLCHSLSDDVSSSCLAAALQYNDPDPEFWMVSPCLASLASLSSLPNLSV